MRALLRVSVGAGATVGVEVEDGQASGFDHVAEELQGGRGQEGGGNAGIVHHGLVDAIAKQFECRLRIVHRERYHPVEPGDDAIDFVNAMLDDSRVKAEEAT